MLEKCIEVGGTITGEHGVGVEKIDQMCVQFGARGARGLPRGQARVRPEGLLNPGKAVPTLARCAEFGRMHVRGGQLLAPGAAALLMDAASASFCERIREAAGRRGSRCGCAAAATKDFYGGAPRGELLDTRACAGIVSYEPSELVVSARCGTPLAELESALRANRQMLAFEPPHFGAGATLGGCIAAGLSGPRRAAAGALRDFVLGVRMRGWTGPLAFVRRPGDEERRRLRCLAPARRARSARSA